MKMQDLKKRVQKEWMTFNELEGTIPDPDFRAVIRRYGDLRKKATWVKAFADLYARGSYGYYPYPFEMITIALNSKITPVEEREYLPDVLEAILEIDGGLGLIREGLEQVFGREYFTEEEGREYGNGFLELVKISAERRGLAVNDVWGGRQLTAVGAG